MNTADLKAEIEDHEKSPRLFQEAGFSLRQRALETVGIMEELDSRNPDDAELHELTQRGRALRRAIREYNHSVFLRYRQLLREQRGNYPRIRELLNPFTTYTPEGGDFHHYVPDDLDILVDGILECDPEAARLPKRCEEMIHLERTPARVVLDLVDRLSLSSDDVFYDLGCGLGHVTILLNLLTGIRSRGIEIEEPYCRAAGRAAQFLGLRDVSFVHADILSADFSDGTVFFFFTPFTGSVLRDVLDRLRELARRRTLRICSHGTITMELAKEDWVKVESERMLDPYVLAVFRG